MKKIIGLFFLLLCAVLSVSGLDGRARTANANRQAADQFGIWYDVNQDTIRRAGERQIVPLESRTLAADLGALDNLLSRAPLEFSQAAESTTVILPLPLPDGTVAHFRIEESPIMESELAAKYPQIKSYLGHGIDDPTATVRFDRTPAGFHAMILSSAGTVYIDPYSKGDIAHYMSYYKHDFRKELDEAFKPDVVLSNLNAQSTSATRDNPSILAVGEQLRTYRLAVATTGEYTAFAGGTTEQGLAAVTTTINRVTGIYEREFSIRLTLVNNNDEIIFTDADTDPFENSDADLKTNQTVVDSRIQSANYDIGHVFVTSGGGVARLGVVCDASDKALGLTGLPNPVGDPFDVDFVAHEIGHQFGAEHTQNNPCQRNAETAYEPGSGSTIMGYAGVCAPNLQNNSDDYFHAASFDEIIANISSGTGSECGTPTGTGNTPPTAEAGASYNIPAKTPFMLTGSASDSDNGASLTYGWEQFDLGRAWDGQSLPNTDNGNRPIFRSYKPVSSPSRMFPKLETILSGDLSNEGEFLPTSTRSLTFRLTVRDNQAGGGGVAKDQTTLNVTDASGPFAVTAPNSPLTLTWAGGSQQSVTWNVANTTAAPVSCSEVNILLSTNGGTSFAHTLVSSTANDGSEPITVPNDATSSARIKVECANNIFFDISNANFTITAGLPTSTPTSQPTATSTPTSQPAATSTPTSQPAATSTPTAIPTDPTALCSTASTTITTDKTTIDELTVTDSGTLRDLNVSLKATHSRIGDLSFTLEYNDTGGISLIDLADCEGADIDATLDDEASSSVEDATCNSTPALSGSLKPNEALSSFDGSALTGTWRLTIENSGYEQGSLTEWCLIPTISDSAATATPSPQASPTPGSGATVTPSPTAEGTSSMLYLPITIK